MKYSAPWNESFHSTEQISQLPLFKFIIRLVPYTFQKLYFYNA